MSVLAAVEAKLGGDTSWQAEAARSLARAVDEGSAAAARELRALMAAIAESELSKAGDELDEFRARRTGRPARGAKAAGGERATAPVDQARTGRGRARP